MFEKQSTGHQIPHQSPMITGTSSHVLVSWTEEQEAESEMLDLSRHVEIRCEAKEPPFSQNGPDLVLMY